MKHICATCSNYDGTFCTVLWNNLDESYCVPDRDIRDPDDTCDYWDTDPMYCYDDE